MVEERLASLKAAHGDRLAIVCGDVRSLTDNQKAVELAVSKFGKLDVFGVNVKGYMIGAAAAREELIKSQGCIVLALSTSSFYIGSGSIYSASKHAAPSGTPTSFADAESLLEPDADRTLARTGGPNSNILERQTEPDDHAASYVLLASDQSAVMTGSVINSDAGRGVSVASQR